MNNLDDRALVEKATQGENAAFGELTNRHWQRVFATVKGIISHWHTAEDITQDAFNRAHRKLKEGKLTEASKIASWLCVIARNLAFRERAETANRGKYIPTTARPPEDIPDEHGHNPAAGMEAEELEGLIGSNLRSVARKRSHAVREVHSAYCIYLDKGEEPAKARSLAIKDVARALLIKSGILNPDKEPELLKAKMHAIHSHLVIFGKSPPGEKLLTAVMNRRHALWALCSTSLVIAGGVSAHAYDFDPAPSLDPDELDGIFTRVDRLRNVSACIARCQAQLAPALRLCMRSFSLRPTDRNARLVFEAADRALALSLDAMEGCSRTWLDLMRQALEAMHSNQQACALSYDYRRAQNAHYTGNSWNALKIARNIATAGQARRFASGDSRWRLAEARGQSEFAIFLAANGLRQEAEQQLAATNNVMRDQGDFNSARRCNGLLLTLKAEAGSTTAADNVTVLQGLYRQMTGSRLPKVQLGARLLRCHLLAGQEDEALKLHKGLSREIILSGYCQGNLRMTQAYACAPSRLRDEFDRQRRRVLSAESY